MTTSVRLEIRRAVDADEPAILSLLSDSLGWARDDRHDALFAWKHRESSFGPSPAWVAFDGGRLAGVRLFLRWEFTRGDEVLRAVRAVDTATHPDYQGRGVFTELTLRALDDLDREGVAIVFNTPNDQSRPGYLKMGWQVIGRVPVAVRATSPRALVKMLRARVPAERWSAPSGAGSPARELLGDRVAIEALLASRTAGRAITTRASAGYLAWRYASPPIDYRALAAHDGPESGLALFRVRERGPTRELVVADVIVPGDDPRLRRELLKRVARVADADYLIATTTSVAPRAGFLHLPRQGPILTSRLVADGGDPPPLPDWRLTLGDVELF
jgi:GNAT superfamily N-acetyltransferase